MRPRPGPSFPQTSSFVLLVPPRFPFAAADGRVLQRHETTTERTCPFTSTPDVRGLIGFIGTSVGGAIGWWLGAKVGIMTAVALSGVGSGVGLWAARRWMSEHLP
ncbi:MAG TPA: hypothetical protein VF041_00435 [Gemmatimonadaceae bacterium]